MASAAEREKRGRNAYRRQATATYLVEIIIGSFRIVDGRLVTVMAEMARCDKTVAPYITPNRSVSAWTNPLNRTLPQVNTARK